MVRCLSRLPSWALTVALAALVAVWAPLGSLALAGAAALAVLVALRPAWRTQALAIVAALAWACVLALGCHFARDHFALRYVWLYSSADLPLHLKIANVWGGDEGTTLLLAACLASLAASGARAGLDGGRTSVAAALVAWHGVLALWLGPFAATPADWLAQLPRYLKALCTRIERLPGQYPKDQSHTAQLQGLAAPLWAAADSHPGLFLLSPEALQYRWLLEEFRVSLFAQNLGTRQAVSAKRLQEHWQAVAQWLAQNPR